MPSDTLPSMEALISNILVMYSLISNVLFEPWTSLRSQITKEPGTLSSSWFFIVVRIKVLESILFFNMYRESPVNFPAFPKIYT